MRDALSLLDQVIASSPAGLTEAATAETLGVADRTLLDKLGRAVLGKDAHAALALVDAAFTRGQDLSQLAHAFLGHLRDLVVARAVDDPSALIDASPSELEALVAGGAVGAGGRAGAAVRALRQDRRGDVEVAAAALRARGRPRSR